MLKTHTADWWHYFLSKPNLKSTIFEFFNKWIWFVQTCYRTYNIGVVLTPATADTIFWEDQISTALHFCFLLMIGFCSFLSSNFLHLILHIIVLTHCWCFFLTWPNLNNTAFLFHFQWYNTRWESAQYANYLITIITIWYNTRWESARYAN